MEQLRLASYLPPFHPFPLIDETINFNWKIVVLIVEAVLFEKPTHFIDGTIFLAW